MSLNFHGKHVDKHYYFNYIHVVSCLDVYVMYPHVYNPRTCSCTETHVIFLYIFLSPFNEEIQKHGFSSITCYFILKYMYRSNINSLNVALFVYSRNFSITEKLGGKKN